MRRRIKSTANAATRPGPFSSPPRGQGAGCEGQWSGGYLDGRPRLMPTISERRSLLAFRESSKAGRHIECVPSANSTRSTNYSCRSADSLGDSYWKMRRGFQAPSAGHVGGNACRIIEAASVRIDESTVLLFPHLRFVPDGVRVDLVAAGASPGSGRRRATVFAVGCLLRSRTQLPDGAKNRHDWK